MITFFVEGEPRPKQSFRVSGRGRGFTPARVKAWQADIGWRAQQEMRSVGFIAPINGDVKIELDFYMGDRRRVDCDNLSKAVLDACNGICWCDDRQVVDLHIRKHLADPVGGPVAGVAVKVELARYV